MNAAKRTLSVLDTNSDIKLPKVGEETPKSPLPRGVHMVRLGERIVFVRRVAGRMLPIPQVEQEALAQKLGWTNG